MELQYQKIEEEMPIPEDNIKQGSHPVPNSNLVMKDYSNYK